MFVSINPVFLLYFIIFLTIDLILFNLPKVKSLKLQESFNFNLVFNVFDCLNYSNSWVVSETLEKRREIVANILRQLKHSNMPVRLVPYINQNKKDFYDKCIANGLEGCVAKNKNSIYVTDSSRSKNGWIKIKKSVVAPIKVYDPNKPFSLDELFNKSTVIDTLTTSNPFTFGDTIDAFITGYTAGDKGTLSEGYIKSLEVSTYVDGHVRSLGYVSNMSSDIRTKATTLVNNIPTLTPMFFNRVVELSSDANMIMRVRYDKSSTDCTLSKNIFEVLSRN